MKKQLLRPMFVALMALMGMSTAWADDTYTEVYGRTTVASWTEADIAEWGGSEFLSINADHGLFFNTTKPSTAYSATKSFSISENAKVKYEVNWYVANSTGRTSNFEYIQFGDKVRIGYTSDYKFYLDLTGTCSTTTALTTQNKTPGTSAITIIFNTATNSVESFIFRGTDITNQVSSALEGTFNSVSFGFQRGGSTSNWDYPNGIETIKVSQAEQTVSTANYTINYTFEENNVKSFTSTSIVGAEIFAEKAIDGNDGQHYLVIADEIPSIVLTAGENVLNVPVRKPYTAKVYLTWITEDARGGLVFNPVETDDKECKWSIAHSLYIKPYNPNGGPSNIYYRANNDETFGEEGTFTNGETISRDVYYTKDPTVVFFNESSTGTGTNYTLSNGSDGFVAAQNARNRGISVGSLPAGTYKFIVNITAANKRSVVLREGTNDPIASLGTSDADMTTGIKEVEFTLDEDTDNLWINGANSGEAKTNQSENFDYALITKDITPAYGEIWSGTKAFPVEEYESISLNTAYFKDFVKAGDVIKVTLQPAAEEARAEAPMRDIKRFGELALLAADESIIAENGEVALDTEDYSFTVEESWIEKLSTGNNIYLRGRNLTVTKIELLEAVFEPVDCTAKVSTENWLSEQGSVGGPVTLDGIAQKEQYNASTTAIIEGDVLYQVVEGLQNGTYKVELYANASFTSGRGFTSDIIDGQLGRVVVYAGDVDKTIPVFDQGWVNTNNIVTLENVVVSDGTLRMGLKKIAPGTNWHTIQIKSLTQVSNKAEADADAQDTYWKGIAATVAAYEAYANVAGSEKAAIVAAETKAAAQAAIPPFYAAKPSYDALAEIIAKANSADYDVAEAEALMASTETTAEQAAAKAAELLHPVTLAVNTKAVEGASKDNPIETNFVVNGTFDTAGVIAPWKSTTGAQNQTTANNQHGAFGVENSFFFENWNPDPFTGKMYQEIEDIPNGLYTLKICAFVNTFDATAQYVYANTDQTPLTTGEPTAYEVQTNVTTNTIEIGLEQIVAVANWMGVDNVSLIYKGDGTATAINEVTAKQNTGNAIYNLQGQKVQNARKGLYIINGKKVLK